MNISSIVLNTLPENLDALITEMKNSDKFEYHLHDKKGRIIITIEADNVDTEVGMLRELQKMPKVIDAVMSFSYTEHELEQQKDKLEIVDTIPDWLNNPEAKLKDITYNGDLKGRF